MQKLKEQVSDFRARILLVSFLKAYPDFLPSGQKEASSSLLDVKLKNMIQEDLVKMMDKDITTEQILNSAKILGQYRQIVPVYGFILGLPGETKEEFMQTIDLIKEMQPDIVNISRYSDRPGTSAAMREDQIEGSESKDRSRFLTRTFEFLAFEKNKKWRGWEGEVVITEIGKDNSWVGRNLAYKPVILHGNYKLGDKAQVRIMYNTVYDLRGEEQEG